MIIKCRAVDAMAVVYVVGVALVLKARKVASTATPDGKEVCKLIDIATNIIAAASPYHIAFVLI